MEVTLMVIGLAEPVRARKSELVLMEGDSVPVTSTSLPR